MAEPSVQKVGLGLGSAGAIVDVTSELQDDTPVSWAFGRQSQFEDFVPGRFSFTLSNLDGRFTPGNTVAATGAGFASTLVEGVAAVFEVESRLVSGKVRNVQPYFEQDTVNGSRVVVTVDDMLGSAGRRRLGPLSLEIALASGCSVIPFDDPAGSTSVRTIDNSGYGTLSPLYSGATYLPPSITFGEAGFEPGLSEARFDAAAGVATAFGEDPSASYGSPIASRSSGVWITPLTDTGYLEVHNYYTEPYRFGVQNDQFMFWEASTSSWIEVMRFTVGETYFVAMNGETMLIDGVTVATDHVGYPSPADWSTWIVVGNAAFGESSFRLSNWASIANSYLFPVYKPERVKPTTITNRLGLLGDALTADITLDTLPTDLSDALLGIQGASGGSGLDALNDALRTEQGHLYSESSGTFAAPVQKVVVRGRDRPAAVDYTFSLADDVQNSPEFIRDLTNMVSTVNVSGPTQQITVTDAALVSQVGSANASETVLFEEERDLQSWGEDRLIRGSNWGEGVRVSSITVDAASNDRWSDLLGLTLGDRIQVTGIPAAQLGFSTWDGWLIGVQESHQYGQHLFTLYMAPALPDTAIFDTDVFASRGELTDTASELNLSGAMDATQTTQDVATSGAKITTTDFPFTIQVDDEQMTVTGCTGATPQVVTVTRGVNGTTAATHPDNSTVNLVDPIALFAF